MLPLGSYVSCLGVCNQSEEVKWRCQCWKCARREFTRFSLLTWHRALPSLHPPMSGFAPPPHLSHCPTISRDRLSSQKERQKSPTLSFSDKGQRKTAQSFAKAFWEQSKLLSMRLDLHPRPYWKWIWIRYFFKTGSQSAIRAIQVPY